MDEVTETSGNWVDQSDGCLSSGPAVQFTTNCVSGYENRTADEVNQAFYTIGTPDLEYDDNGNLVTYGDLTLTYDAFNRLTAVSGTNIWGDDVDVAYLTMRWAGACREPATATAPACVLRP